MHYQISNAWRSTFSNARTVLAMRGTSHSLAAHLALVNDIQACGWEVGTLGLLDLSLHVGNLRVAGGGDMIGWFPSAVRQGPPRGYGPLLPAWNG